MRSLKMKTRLVCFLAAFAAVMMVVVDGKEEGTKEVPSVLTRSLIRSNAKEDKAGKTHGTARDLARKRPYCRTSSKLVYKTVNLGRFAFRRRNDRAGTCASMCPALCQHKACMQDYKITGSTCECAAAGTAGPMSCVANAVCNPTTDTCACQVGYTGNATSACVDVDECKVTPSICGSSAAFQCINTVGSYKCTEAPKPKSPTRAPNQVEAPAASPKAPSAPVAMAPSSGGQPKLADGAECLGDGCNQCESPATTWNGLGGTACGESPNWKDGVKCEVGVSCYNCENEATFWYAIATTACGTEPSSWTDGTQCEIGTSCNVCQSQTATYWYAKNMTCCGEEPKWTDGLACELWTSCDACQNQATTWYSKNVTACGSEPSFDDGVKCEILTSCNACRNNAAFWAGPADNRCGSSPNWADGTVCSGMDCNKCRSNATFWAGLLLTACGVEPKLTDGTQCAASTTCNACQNAHTLWWGTNSTACGIEPRLDDGTPCLAGTTCLACSNPATYWYKLSTQACGEDPNKLPDGTLCALETTCRQCLNNATIWGEVPGNSTGGVPKCGKEPCWPQGTSCLVGTTCKKCCREMSGETKCGIPIGRLGACWEQGRICGVGTTCKNCCREVPWAIRCGDPNAPPIARIPATKSPTRAPRAPQAQAPTIPPIVAPTAVPPEISALVDEDLIVIAKNARSLKASLWDLAVLFENNKSNENRHNLQQETLAVLAAATARQIKDLTADTPFLENWNEQGGEKNADGVTKRQQMCQLLSLPNSKVASNVKNCMCGSVDSYIRCDILLGNQAWIFRENRRRERRLAEQNREPEPAVRRMTSRDLDFANATHRDLKVSCSASGSVELDKVASFNDFILAVQRPGLKIDTSVSCCMELPPPLSLLEMCGTISIQIPAVNWLMIDGAKAAIASGEITKGSDIIKGAAEDTKISLLLQICFVIDSLIDKNPEIKVLMDFLGIDFCVITYSLTMWPASASARAAYELTLGAFFAEVSLLWQMDTTLRDILGICDNVVPECEDADTIFCALESGQVAGSLNMGVSFFLFEAGLSVELGDAFYRNCDKEPDGKRCNLGSTCNKCRNKASYWYRKTWTACGKEPPYKYGDRCAAGTSCKRCDVNVPATLWVKDGLFKCGKEPCWSPGASCGVGTTCGKCCREDPWKTVCGDPNDKNLPDGRECDGTYCNFCKSKATYWNGMQRVACGTSPNWADGTECGLRCDACRNPATFWVSRFHNACGVEPKWSDGSRCGAGTTCSQCLNPATYWYIHGFTCCGKEKPWSDGAACAQGTTCNACLNPATYWVKKGFTACGPEACWGRGAFCALGTTCKKCCVPRSLRTTCG